MQGNKECSDDEEQEHHHVNDDHLLQEHFVETKGYVAKLLESVYFPKVDSTLNPRTIKKDDVKMYNQHEKIIDSIIVELVTLQEIMKEVGQVDTSTSETPKHTYVLQDHQRHIIGGLMKRLLNQIPAKVPGTEYQSDDFEVKISNLYLMMESRVSMKKIFEVSLGVSMTTTYDEINTVCERIMGIILDYEEYCREQEDASQKPKLTKENIMNHFQKKIADKLSKSSSESPRRTSKVKHSDSPY